MPEQYTNIEIGDGSTATFVTSGKEPTDIYVALEGVGALFLYIRRTDDERYLVEFAHHGSNDKAPEKLQFILGETLINA